MKPYWMGVVKALLAVAWLGGCGQEKPDAEVGVVEQRLEVSNDVVLGFEQTEPAWQVSAGTATLGLTEDRVEGEHAMVAVANSGWFELVSAPLSTINPITDRISMIVKAPETSYWAGYVQVRLTSATLGIDEMVASFGFLSATPNTFYRLNCMLDEDIRTTLAAATHTGAPGYSDLVIRLTFNVPSGGTYVLDRLWFGQETLPSDLYADNEITIELPQGLGWDDLALHASRELRVNDGARVQVGWSETEYAAIASVGSLASNIGVWAKTGDLWSVPDVMLRSNAQVFGSVRTGAPTVGKQDATPVVHGDELPAYDFRPWSSVTWRVPMPNEEFPGLNVQTWNPLDGPLAPGNSYGPTTVGSWAHLWLVPGEYVFRGGLTLEPDAQIHFDNSAPIVVYVLDSFIYRATMLREYPDLSNVLFVYLGEVAVGLEQHFRASIMAPYAKVWTGAGKDTVGSIHAKEIEIHQNGIVRLDPFERTDCAAVQGECGAVVGCQPLDTDGDRLSDCDEDDDEDPWTDPGVFNGVHARLYPACHPEGPSNGLLMTPDQVAACTQDPALEELEQSGGWDWQNPDSANSCLGGFGFLPRWGVCRDDWLVVADSFLDVPSEGRWCFRMQGDTTGAAGALFLEDHYVTGLNLQTVCWTLGQGVYSLRWVYERTGSPGQDMAVTYCLADSGDCVPTEPLDQRRLRASYSGPPPVCDEATPCSPVCPCPPGKLCSSAEDCDDGMPCVPNMGGYYGEDPTASVCTYDGCLIAPEDMGCGYEGAPCGEKCTLSSSCDDDSDCAPGVCGRANGIFFGLPGVSVCWPPICELDPVAGGCGTPRDPCGECRCVPSCSGKICGSDPADGCGGLCLGLCGPDEGGCTGDSDCPSGYACLFGAGPQKGLPEGTNLCLPRVCSTGRLPDTLCGTLDSPCGLCPECPDACAGRVCGMDPVCGVDCGTCPDGSSCVSAGQCIASISDPEITIPDGSGGTRVLEPLPPIQTTAVGALAGSFGVNDRGLAVYDVPVQVPPGRAGMQPEVSITYNGTRGGAHLGSGWQLGGLSQITRCQRIYALDGYTAPVNRPVNREVDPLCLDGKRLVAFPDQTYGANGTQYRTVINTMSKVVSYGGTPGDGPDHFKVWTWTVRSSRMRRRRKQMMSELGTDWSC